MKGLSSAAVLAAAFALGAGAYARYSEGDVASTSDSGKNGAAQSTSTETSTNVNRSTARPQEPEL